MTNYILFPTTRTFIRGMKVAESTSIPHRVMAVPTHITHECGMCLQLAHNEETLNTISALLLQHQIEHTIISEE